MSDEAFELTPETIELLRQEYIASRDAWLAAKEAEKTAARECDFRRRRFEAGEFLFKEMQPA